MLGFAPLADNSIAGFGNIPADVAVTGVAGTGAVGTVGVEADTQVTGVVWHQRRWFGNFNTKAQHIGNGCFWHQRRWFGPCLGSNYSEPVFRILCHYAISVSKLGGDRCVVA